jgi:hypothetical protein
MTKPTKGPLRLITQVLIAAADVYSRQKVKLECGHEVWCSSGAAHRARCRHCAGPAGVKEDGNG